MTTSKNKPTGNKPDKKLVAARTLSPSINAAAVILEFGDTFGDQDFLELVNELNNSIDAVNDGNLKRCEAMLLGQAHALQAIFMNLARKANVQSGLKQYETHFRLALKAQSQCRATIETLAAIKNPPIVFAKQANISNGHQQINNGTPAASRAEEIKNQQNELLEVQNGSETLDGRATSAAISKNKAMATVETVNRG